MIGKLFTLECLIEVGCNNQEGWKIAKCKYVGGWGKHGDLKMTKIIQKMQWFLATNPYIEIIKQTDKKAHGISLILFMIVVNSI